MCTELVGVLRAGVGGSWTDEDRNLGVVNDVVGDAAKERASNGVETSSADDDQFRLLSVSDAHDAMTSVLERRLTTNFVLYLPHTHTIMFARWR